MQALILSEASYPEHQGGAGRCAHLLATGLARRGHAVHLVSVARGEPERRCVDGVEVHRVPVDHDWGVLLPSQQERRISERLLIYLRDRLTLNSVDVVHDVGGFLSYYYRVAGALRAQYAIPVIVHFQFLNLAYRRACNPQPADAFSASFLGLDIGFNERVQCYAARLADLVVAPSFSEASVIRRLYRPVPGRLTVVPNPVDVALYPSEPDADWQERLGAARASLVLFGGRIDDVMKGADILGEAFAGVLKVRPDARLVVLAPPQAVSPLARRLGPALVCLGWVRDAGTVARILSAVHVVVVPSRYEPFGLMALEAMAAGVPVVATPSGGLKELVRSGYNGVVVRGRSPKAWTSGLARALVTLLSDRTLATQMGHRGRTLAHGDYRVDRVTERIEALYRMVRVRVGRQRVRPLFARPVDLDRAAYAALMRRVAGAEAAARASSMRWRYPCATCTRSVLAETQGSLLSLVGTRPAICGQAEYKRWLAKLRAASSNVCPLGMMQRAYLGSA